MNVPGAIGGWSVSRDYNSRFKGNDAAIQGNRWTGGALDQYFYKKDISGKPPKYKFYLSATSKRVFQAEVDGGGGWPNNPVFIAKDLGLKISVTNVEIKVEPYQGRGRFTWTYYGFGSTVPSHRRGMPKTVTDRYGQFSNLFKFGTASGVNSQRVTEIVTAQDFEIEYNYIQSGVNAGKIDFVELKNPANEVLKRVEYTYFESGQGYSSDTGATGDLILVKHLVRDSNDDLTSTDDSDFAMRKLTHYRYSGDGLLKHVFTDGDVRKILADDNHQHYISDVLSWSDTKVVANGRQLKSYASRSYEYYTSNVNMASVTTLWAGTTENLESKYNDDPVASADKINENGWVKKEIARGTPDAEGQFLTRQFYYMQVDNPDADDPASTKRIVIEDTVDSTGQFVRRNVTGLNNSGALLRGAAIPDPGGTDFWCTSTVIGGKGTDAEGQIVEQRATECHLSVDTNAELAKFLNPTRATNDADTLSSTEGQIVVNTYDTHGRMIDSKLKRGSSGTAYYVEAMTYDSTHGYVSELYDFDEKTTTKANGHKTTFSYTYHPSTVGGIKTKTTTYPAVPTSQNGPGVSGVVEQYWDGAGRLRWTKQPNGSVSYRAYDPDTNRLSYTMADVDTNDLPSELINGQTNDWGGWGSSSPPAGFDNTDDDNVQMASKTVYDDLGRVIQSEDSTLGCCGGSASVETTYTFYDQWTTYTFPAWDSNTQQPQLPIRVTVRTSQYGNTLESYSVDPARVTVTSGLPTGLSAGTDQSHYLSWRTYTYNDQGRRLYSDRYHDIPSSGAGTLGTNFYRTVYRYDDQGRRSHTISIVEGTSNSNAKEQVTQTLFDGMGRAVGTKTGVSSVSHNMGSEWLTDPTLMKMSEREFDHGGVGDGLLTKAKRFHDTGANDYTASVQHYDWQGQLRGSEAVYHDGSSEVSVGPYSVVDYDWGGSAIARAAYDTNPTWATVLGDEDYAATIATNRRSLGKSIRDNLGRVYRSEAYVVNSSTGAAGDKAYLDRYRNPAGQIVATETASGGSSGAGVEYVFDGLGRIFQGRLVKALSTIKFTSGSFNYQAPLPKRDLDDMTGGDDGVIALSHAVFDGNGRAIEQISVSANHDDINGIDWSNKDDLVSNYSFSWYDDIGRMTHAAAYGTGTGGYSQAGPAPSRPSSPPSRSDTVLVSSVTYDTAGRRDTVTDPKGQVTRYVYDDLGRTLRVIEADGSTSDERSTLTVYNGSSATMKLIADLDNNGAESAGDQVTEYFYEDLIGARRLTKTEYPDSSGASDVVLMAYHQDGRVDTRTDQRGTLLTMLYDGIRRPESQQVTTLGGSTDGAVRARLIDYDDLGRPEFISSYDNTAGTGSPLDQIQYVYNDLGQLITEYQEHDGAVNTSTSPKVQMTYDLSATSGVLDNGARMASMIYPNGAEVNLGYDGHGGLDDLLSRPNKITTPDGSGSKTLAEYHYTAGGMMVKKLLGDASGGGDQLVLDFTGEHPDTSSTEDYGGVDRFGRISRMHWTVDDGSTETDAFDIRHGYDRASNKLYAERKIYTNHTQAFGHDDLHRMTSVNRGFAPVTSGSYSAISDLPEVDSNDLIFNGERQDWDLDALGNPKSIDEQQGNDYVKNTSFSDANEFESREVDSTEGTTLITDSFGVSSTVVNWESIGSETATISGGHLNVSPVVVDNLGGQAEGAARAVFLWGGEFGPIANQTRFKFSSSITTQTRAGVVFGYKDEHNYWISAYNYVPSGQSKREICQVVNGVLTVKTSSNITINPGSNTGPHFGSTRALINEAGLTYSSFINGYPAGRIGVYTESALVTFDDWDVWPHDKPSDLAGRWDRYSSSDTSSGSIQLINSDIRRHYPTLLRSVRHQADKPWRATFMFRRSSASRNRDGLRFLFNVQGHDTYDHFRIYHQSGSVWGAGNAKHLVKGVGSSVSGTGNTSNMPLAANQNDDLWVRVEYDDGTNKISVKAIIDNSGEPSDSAWSSTGTTYESTNFVMTGGRVGFKADYGSAYVKEFKLETDNDDNGTFTTEYAEDMGSNWSSGYATVEHEHDAAGNLTFDGTFKFTYDAWNRLTKIENAYRDPDAPTVVQVGSTIAEYRYDAVNRRIVREQSNAGDLDGEFHDYYTAGWQRIETRDGSGNSLKMNVWGLGYIDELVMTSLNSSESSNSSFGSDGLGGDVSDRFFTAHDSLFNVMGVYYANTSDNLSLKERYEYTPYGERQVYVSAGSDDPMAMTPVSRGTRMSSSQTAVEINEVGFQGREHDEVSGLMYHRYRMTHTKLERFMQRDPLGYVDGMSVYSSYYVANGSWDPSGLCDCDRIDNLFSQIDELESGLVDDLGRVSDFEDYLDSAADAISSHLDTLINIQENRDMIQGWISHANEVMSYLNGLAAGTAGHGMGTLIGPTPGQAARAAGRVTPKVILGFAPRYPTYRPPFIARGAGRLIGGVRHPVVIAALIGAGVGALIGGQNVNNYIRELQNELDSLSEGYGREMAALDNLRREYENAIDDYEELADDIVSGNNRLGTLLDELAGEMADCE